MQNLEPAARREANSNDIGDPHVGPTDAAALAASSLAVVLTTYMHDGAYDLVGALVSGTLVWTLLSFLLGRSRNPAERIAFAAVVALTAIPLMCFIIEHINSHDPANFFTGIGVRKGRQSQVGSMPTLIAFILAIVMVSLAEARYTRQKWRASTRSRGPMTTAYRRSAQEGPTDPSLASRAPRAEPDHAQQAS